LKDEFDDLILGPIAVVSSVGGGTDKPTVPAIFAKAEIDVRIADQPGVMKRL
jgi:hypothetical protein